VATFKENVGATMDRTRHRTWCHGAAEFWIGCVLVELWLGREALHITQQKFYMGIRGLVYRADAY